jgi:hypothetical protein
VKEAPPRTKPAPPLMLTIPDPSRRTDEPPAAAPAPDEIPVQTFDLPGAPTLPAGK